jgi:transcription antitermination factor NusA-like protein
MFNQTEEKSQVNMYKGYKGIKTVFEDFLKEGKGGEHLVLDSSGSFVDKMPYYAPHFIKGLETNRIKVRHIVQKGKDVRPSKTTEVRFFPKGARENPISTNIGENKITFVLWSDVPEAVVIKDKAAAAAYRDYFEMLWKSANK